MFFEGAFQANLRIPNIFKLLMHLDMDYHSLSEIMILAISSKLAYRFAHSLYYSDLQSYLDTLASHYMYEFVFVFVF